MRGDPVTRGISRDQRGFYRVRLRRKGVEHSYGSFARIEDAIARRDEVLLQLGETPKAGVCDVCGRSTSRLVLKLFKARVRQAGRTRTRATNYSHHANVGECCVVRINEISWEPRQPRINGA